MRALLVLEKARSGAHLRGRTILRVTSKVLQLVVERSNTWGKEKMTIKSDECSNGHRCVIVGGDTN